MFMYDTFEKNVSLKRVKRGIIGNAEFHVFENLRLMQL
jgi:hypothetical protein